MIKISLLHMEEKELMSWHVLIVIISINNPIGCLFSSLAYVI
jgi:hypothetical protein